MVYKQPQGTYKFTPTASRPVFFRAGFSVPSDGRYTNFIRSSVFDERYSVTNYGYTPSFLDVPTSFNIDSAWYDVKDIFSRNSHESIAAIHKLNSNSGNYSDYVYGDISLNLIEKSLTEDLKDAINGIKNFGGTSLKTNILNTIQSLLIRNELKYFDSSYFKRLADTQKRKEYSEYKSADVIKDENLAVKKAIDNSSHLDNKHNSAVVHPLLKYWRTHPEDVDKRLVVLAADGTKHLCYISSDDTLHVSDSIVAYEAGDKLLVNSSTVLLTSDISEGKARITDIIDTEKIFNLLNTSLGVKFTVETKEDDSVESSINLTTERNSYTVMNLNIESVSDVENANPLLRTTTATYTTTTTINTDLETKAYPNAVFFINNEDQILDYLIDKETADLTFTDFTLSFFNNVSDKSFVRRLPQHIVIVPTDKTEYLPFHGKSKMSTFGTRSITFVPHFEEEKQELRMQYCSHLTYIVATDTFTFNTTSFPATTYYKKSTETVPRQPGSVNKSLVVMNALFRNYGTLPSRTPFFELFYRLTPAELQSLRLDLNSFEDFKAKLRLQKLSSIASVSEGYPKFGDTFKGYGSLSLLSYEGVGSEAYPILNVYKHLIDKKFPLPFFEGYPYYTAPPKKPDELAEELTLIEPPKATFSPTYTGTRVTPGEPATRVKTEI